MLKFICVSASLVLSYCDFKTSHVKVYPGYASISSASNIHFKTSHVKVYPNTTDFISIKKRISKHPMLKFINIQLLYGISKDNFKTSHVKVYPTHFLHFIQSTISDFSVFINILKFFTSRRALCQKNSQNRCNATVFADSRNFTLIGGW